MFLFFAWIPLANAFIKPISNELVSMSLNKNSSVADLRCSNEACPGHCESRWTYFHETDACYKTFFEADFYHAEYICNTYGGHLASIHSYDENVFVAELARMGRPYSYTRDLTWIGLKSEVTQSMNWTWTDGTKLYQDPYVVEGYSYLYQKWTNNYCTICARTFVCKKMALH